MLDSKLLQLLYYTVQNYNILPITSVCNVRCIFCSHKQNPPGIMAVGVPPLPFNLIKDLIGFLDKNKKIVIGESASLIMEGEPFTHPNIIETLELMRCSYPKTIIQLTTNGSFFDEATVRKIKEFEPLEINLSINSADLQLRKKLMNDKRAVISCKAPEVLNKYNITYHGSIVAMPHITGFSNLYESLKILSETNSRTIRVFKPGFTKYTPQNLLPGQEALAKLSDKIKEWRGNLCPITFEPPFLKDLSAEVVGVIRESPAELAGITMGDIIVGINGTKPFSRVEAFKALQKNGDYNITLKGNQQIKQTKLKVINNSSGLVFDFDLPFAIIEEIKAVLTKINFQKTVLLSSQLGYELLRKSLADTENLQVVPVRNNFFGGNIQCAGLLVIDDFANAYSSIIEHGEKPDLLILPAVSFDKGGRDITGKGIWELEELIQCPIELV